MSLIVCADVHYKEGIVAGKSIPSQCEAAITEVFQYANQKRAKVVIAGDLFDACNLPTDVIRRFNRFINELAIKYQRVKAVYIIMGNHELTPKHDSVLSLIDWPTNFYLLDDAPQIISCSGSMYVTTLAYMHAGYVDAVRSIEDKKNTILISHIMVDGSYTRRKLVSEINKELFKEFKLVILGDVHKRQQLGDNIFYTGCLVPTSGCDAGYQPGFIEVVNDKVVYHDLKSVPVLPVSEASDREKEHIQISIEKVLSGELPETCTFSPTDALDLISKIIKNTTPDSNIRKQYLEDFKRMESGK